MEWRFERIHSSSISTLKSANTRAVSPLNFGKIGPPFIPSEEGCMMSRGLKGFTAIVLALPRVLILEL